MPVDNVLRADDIPRGDGKVLFTDGCGRMSERLRNMVSKVGYGISGIEVD